MSRHILLIQDDAAAAKTILDALSNSSDESFQVEWVRRCSEGLERLAGTERREQTASIAAILIDLFLPDGRGIETFDRLFRVAPRIPILILCTPPEEETAKLAVQCGAQDYLFKARLDAYLLPKAVGSMIERAANSEALFEQKERAQITLNSIADAVMSTDVSGHVTYLNAIAETLTGWLQEEAVGHPLEDVFRIVDATTRETAPNPLAFAIRENKTIALTPNCLLIRRDGVEAAIEDSTAPLHDRRGQVTGAVMIFHDVSAAQAMTLKISYLAQHDSLTDLPNRVLLNDRLAEAIALSSRHQRKLAVLLLDLDRFKHINDSLGHVIGDRLLQSVGSRLSMCVRIADTVSRQGGDEFVVLLWEVRHAQDAAITADVLKELKDIGVLLALDDFGTCYSSLSYVKRFPIDALKIDQSFVRDLTTDADDAGIVTAVIGMGKNLHMRVVAEGVETMEQLAILQQHGCPQGQGYYFSRPVPAMEFGRLLERGPTDTAFAA